MKLRPDATGIHKLAALAARKAPRGLGLAAVKAGGLFAALFAGDRRVIVERNLRRASLVDVDDASLNAGVAASFEAYGRYYLDSFRLPDLDAQTIDDGFDYVGFEHILSSVERGVGPLLILPHLGGWEWAAFWLAKIHDIKVTAIVEPLEPPELFDWFASFRESLGMNVVPVGPQAGPAILDAIGDGHAVCLLSDRVVAGAAAVPVEFFGEQTLLPAGPATIALRTGAPLIPVGVYFRGDRHFAEVRPPVPAVRVGGFRDDVQRITQALAHELEGLVQAAPEQWHVLQPNWPSDYRALGRPVPDELKSLL
jgi:KDO2-lipid IV(A) lauroyltransferase